MNPHPLLIRTLEVPNVNVAYSEIWHKFRSYGLPEDSRGGDVLVMPGPFLTSFWRPRERVLFDPDRDANPVFHLLEAIWMLAGREDVAFLLPYNARYSEYAEPEGYVHGAYGNRWRRIFGVDQVEGVVRCLKQSPETRQAVMGMWDPILDLNAEVKDRPCNTHIYLDRRRGVLNMTVCCRSNDMVWGAYGANIVHFSILQEYIAAAVGCPVGIYTQMSNNAHVYLDVPIVAKHLKEPPNRYDLYGTGEVSPYPLIGPGEVPSDFLRECEFFCDDIEYKPESAFLTLARALQRAYLARKEGDPNWRRYTNHYSRSIDWVRSFVEWTDRRKDVSKQSAD